MQIALGLWRGVGQFYGSQWPQHTQNLKERSSHSPKSFVHIGGRRFGDIHRAILRMSKAKRRHKDVGLVPQPRRRASWPFRVMRRGESEISRYLAYIFRSKGQPSGGSRARLIEMRHQRTLAPLQERDVRGGARRTGAASRRVSPIVQSRLLSAVPSRRQELAMTAALSASPPTNRRTIVGICTPYEAGYA